MTAKNVLSLVCTSLVFFLAFFIMFSRMPDPVQDTLVPLLVAVLSFCGAVFTISRLKAVSDSWYLGIFHVSAIGIVCISLTSRFFSVAHTTEYLNLSLALLSLTSPGFFMAFPGPERKITRFYALVSGVIGLFAIFLIYLVIAGLTRPLQTSWNAIDAYAGMYLLFLLPLIGFCHVGAALGERAPSDGRDSPGRGR